MSGVLILAFQGNKVLNNNLLNFGSLFSENLKNSLGTIQVIKTMIFRKCVEFLLFRAILFQYSLKFSDFCPHFEGK